MLYLILFLSEKQLKDTANTDASFRYERGVDPEMVIPALLKATKMIVELTGGKIDSNIIDVHPLKSDNFSFEINFENIKKSLWFFLIKRCNDWTT